MKDAARTLSSIRPGSMVWLFGETHQSSMAFENVGIEILKSAASKGFNCLFLEHSTTPFQKAYTEFNTGGSFEETIQKTRIDFFAQFGVRPKKLDSDKMMLEKARSLGFRILAVDRPLTFKEVIINVDFSETPEAIEKRLIDLHERNKLMALRMVLLNKIGSCKGGVLVVGAAHLSAKDMKPISKARVETIPEFLQHAGVEPLVVRLLPKVGVLDDLNSFDIVIDE